jgi:hypothetical protein
MANLPLITVVADVVVTLINGHYRQQQEMAELRHNYLLQKKRIAQETVIACKQIDATLTYALKHLSVQIEQSRQNFALLIKNLDLQLEDSKKIEQYITELMKIATNPKETAEVRLLVLKETLPAMIQVSQTNSEQRHALLAQHLQNSMLTASNLGGFLPKL